MLKLVKHMLANMAGVRTHVSVTSTPHKPRTSSPRKATPQTRKQVKNSTPSTGNKTPNNISVRKEY